MKPLVSILIPAYNAQEWIEYAIRSALGQTWDKKEVIVVDDGSSDLTATIAARYGSKTLTVVSTPNQGTAAARNHALQVSQGDFIQYLDADDLLAPDKIERQLAAVVKEREDDVLLSSPWAYFYYRTRKAQFISTPLCQDLTPVEWLLRKMESGAHMQTATWLVSRQLTDAAGRWDPRLISDDDGEYFCRVISAARAIRFVSGPGVFYRATGTSRLSFVGASQKKKVALLLSIKLHIQYLRALEDSKRVSEACLTYLQKYMIDFYPEEPAIVQEMQELAISLGGHLDPPQLRSKYGWLRSLMGYEAAKNVQLHAPHIKAALISHCDKLLYRLESMVQSEA